MRRNILPFKFVLSGLVFLFLLAGFFHNEIAFAQTSKDSLKNQNTDLSNAILKLEDLPAGFEPSGEWVLGIIDATLPVYQLQLYQNSDEIFPSPIYGVDDIVNLTGFRNFDNFRQDVIYSWLVPSLPSLDQNKFDRAVANSDGFIQRERQAYEDDQARNLPGFDGVGNTHLAYTYTFESGGTMFRVERAVVRRSSILIEIEYRYRDGDAPLLNVINLARILDDRVIAIVGEGDNTAFRPTGPLVPEITTYIPTPLDVSTQPGVIGTNLFLAALMMLPFAVATEYFTQTMSEHEEALRRRVKPLDWISRLKQRMDALAGTRLIRHPALVDVLKLLGVMLFYGLIFSLLDQTWNPISIKGLILFLSMTIAYGIVGVVDDIMQFRAIRKWGLPAELNLRPTNVLVAVLSTATSRLMTLVPGLMFGTPEALQTDESLFDQDKRNRLLKISIITFSTVGLGVWLVSGLTSLLQRQPLSETTGNLVAGLEGFLLVVFAVALENSFVQMLGFAGSFGQALKQKNRWLWLVVLAGVTFLFYHTLLNPHGELAEALKAGNVQLFLGVTGAFVVVTFGLRLYFRWQERRHARGSRVESATIVTATRSEVQAVAPLQTGPVVAASIPVFPTPKVQRAIPQQIIVDQPAIAQAKSIFISINETKTCPVCCMQIKAEARVCRFCKATFTVTLRGYCTADHDVVEITPDGKCRRCGSDVTDMHVESRLLKAPDIATIQVTQTAVTPDQVPAMVGGNTKPCPTCGQIIKAEARICRFCKTRLG